MSVLERPHYVIQPTDLAEWLDQEPETWWMVYFDPRLTGKVDFPCPSEELSDALRAYHKDIFVYPVDPTSMEPRPSGQPSGGSDSVNCSIGRDPNAGGLLCSPGQIAMMSGSSASIPPHCYPSLQD